MNTHVSPVFIDTTNSDFYRSLLSVVIDHFFFFLLASRLHMTLINKFKYLLRWKFTNILVIVFVFFILTHWNTSNSTNPSIRTFDFHSYPDSRSFIEYQRLQIDQVFSLNGEYHSGSYPIIWLDEFGDVHWNQPAQNEMLNYLLEKQFPQDDISTCLTRQLFIVDQWPMGFFSRYHCFIEQFGQTLYSPSMVLLSPRRFAVSHSSNEDFRNEGILRYYQSFSLCSSYINHPQLKTLHDQLPSINSGSANTKNVRSMTDLLADDEKNFRFKYSREIWIFGYDHVPHRRWLFDKNREELKTKLTYTSPIEMLIDHSNEHIYYPTNSKLNLTTWNPRNSPQGPPKHVLPGLFELNLTE